MGPERFEMVKLYHRIKPPCSSTKIPGNYGAWSQTFFTLLLQDENS